MKKLLSANLKENNNIEVSISKDLTQRIVTFFFIYMNGKLIEKVIPLSRNESNNHNIYTLVSSKTTYTPGIEYVLYTDMNMQIPLDISYLATLPAFDEKYRCDDILGANYLKKMTTFRVFSPFASEMKVKIKKNVNDQFEYYSMTRLDNGIYEVTIKKDLEEYIYLYEAKIFSKIYEVADPYSYSLSSNSNYSYVVDINKIKKIDSNTDNLPILDSKLDYIIYECSVRDMTSRLNLKNKSTYKALSESTNIETSNHIKTGIDYISSLGVSHVQLMPVLDFYTVNEDRPFENYNWGYDPNFFLVNEGSYSLDPNDPYLRLIELKNLVSSFHKKGIRVILDVVYNHVFSVNDNSLNILVPKYYFRLNNDGSLSNGSGCGNDIESKHYMARKLIIDSILHFTDIFDIDGFRFDLMGILDTETLSLAYNRAKELKDDIFFLGEGWDLWTNLKANEKCSINNANRIPFASFFNDRFRDVVKGQTNESQLAVRGYLSGDTNYLDGFKHVMLGSSKPIAFAPLFESSTQSVNYLECHDNHVLYDKLKACLPFESDEITFKRIKMCILATLLASGIPFFHAGEEIAQSKQGEGNSYDKGDLINGFDYKLLEKRSDLYYFFIQAIHLKKFMSSLAKEKNVKFDENIQFENLPFGCILIKYIYSNYTISVIFNPTFEKFTYDLQKYNKVIFSELGDINKLDTYCQVAIINSVSFAVYLQEESQDA
mgnify:CR=1 FL=1